MNTRLSVRLALAAALVLAAGTALAFPGPVSSAFTYQGKLKQGASVVDDFADLQFSLFDAATGGAQVGATLTALNVDVQSGIFSVSLDFGSAAFNGDARWLQIAVRVPAGSGAYVPMGQRQPMTAAPYAAYSIGPWTKSGTSLSYSGGNVGVGVSAPSQKLSVAGGVHAAGGATTHGQGLHIEWNKSGFEGESWLLNQKGLGNGGIRFGEVDAANVVTERMRIDSVGNVSIGASSSGHRLNVSSADQYAAAFRSADGIGTRLQLISSATGGRTYELISTANSNANGGGKCLLVDSAVGPRVAVDSSGQVGIGTVSPVDKLTVSGTSTGISVVDGATRLRLGANSGATSIESSGAKPIFFNVAGSQRMAIQSDGRVGVGYPAETAPCKLSVLEDLAFNPAVYGENNASNAFGVMGQSSNATGAGVYAKNTGTSGDSIGLRAESNSPNGRAVYGVVNTQAQGASSCAVFGLNYAIGGTGVWGYAQGSSGSGIGVRGTSGSPQGWAGYFEGRGVFTGALGVGRLPAANSLEVEGNASKTTATAWLANSDSRIKTNVRTINGALDALDRVRLVNFEYTDWYKSQHPTIENRVYCNVIAQEFAKVFPDFVKPSGESLPGGEAILQVDTYPLTIYSAAAVKELHGIADRQSDAIANLQQENRRLQDQLKRLSERLARLESGK